MWADQLEWLGDSAIAPTLYDYGESISDWAREVLDQLGHQTAVVVGASVGGFCALEMARLAPQQVRMVVLVGSKAGVRRDDAARDTALTVLSSEGFESAWRQFWLPLFAPQGPPQIVERAYQLGRAVPEESLLRGVRAFFDRPDLGAFARSWDGRIEAISGEYDTTPSPETSEAVARSAIDGRFHLVKESGHYVNLERPAEFDVLLRRCLRDPGAS